MSSTIDDIRSLFEDYCTLGYIYVGGRKRPRECDWVAEFENALEDFEGSLDFDIELPRYDKYRSLSGPPWGEGSSCWLDTDAQVFNLLKLHGARIAFPTNESGEIASNSELVRFYLFSPPGTTESLFEDHGISLFDLDFDFHDSCLRESNIERLLMESGNAVAFRWIRENKHDQVDWSSFKIRELYNTPLIIPLLEDAKNKSVRSRSVVARLLLLVEEEIRASRFDSALLYTSKLSLSASDHKRLLLALRASPMANSESAVALERYLKGGLPEHLNEKQCSTRPLVWNHKCVSEFIDLAKAGDVEGMEVYMARVGGGKLPPVLKGEESIWRLSPGEEKLFRICSERRSVKILDFLVSKGFDLAGVLSAGVFEEDRLQYDLMAMFPISAHSSYEPLKVYIMRLLATENMQHRWFNSVDVIKEILKWFREDQETLSEFIGMGYDLLPTFAFASKTPLSAAKMQQFMLERLEDAYRDNPETSLIAFLMNNGYRIDVGSNLVKSHVWSIWNESPELLAKLIPCIPVDSIQPAYLLLPVVAEAGLVDSLRALETWGGAYDENSVQAALDAVADSDMVETRAFLLEKQEMYGDRAAGLLELDASSDDSEELRNAKVVGAVLSDNTLFYAKMLIPHQRGPIDLVLPEGIVSLGEDCFEGTRFLLRRLVLPQSLTEIANVETLRWSCKELGMPSVLSDQFEEMTFESLAEQTYLYEEDRLLRVFYHPQQKHYGTFDRFQGDTADIANAALRAMKTERSIERYVCEIDEQYRTNQYKSFRNKSRIALSRLLDSAYLSDEDRAMYIAYVKRNRKKLLPYFDECEDELFARITRQVFEDLAL